MSWTRHDSASRRLQSSADGWILVACLCLANRLKVHFFCFFFSFFYLKEDLLFLFYPDNTSDQLVHAVHDLRYSVFSTYKSLSSYIKPSVLPVFYPHVRISTDSVVRS